MATAGGVVINGKRYDDGQFQGLNTDGIAKMKAAIDAYARAVNSVNFAATKAQLTLYAKGSATTKSLSSLMTSADQQMANLVNQKLKPLSARLDKLTSQYKSNDSNLASSLNSKSKSILKS